MRKSRKLFLFLTAALAALLIAAPLASKPTITAPINALLSGNPADYPAVGDTWTYNYMGITNMTINVTGICTVTDWNESSVSCYNFTQTYQDPLALGYNATWSSAYYRTTDGAQIAGEMYMLANTTGDYEEVQMYIYNDVPMVQGYPYSVGKILNQTIKQNQTGYVYSWYPGPFPPEGWYNYTFVRGNATQTIMWLAVEVLDITTVTVPAGIFETWCLNMTSNVTTPLTPSIVYYSPTVKNFVLLTDPTGGTRLLELLSYSVSYPTRALIQMALSMMLLLFLNSQQQQGATIRNYLIIGGVAGIIIVAAAIGIILRGRHV